VPKELREELRAALESLDPERIGTVIEGIGKLDAELALLLKQLTEKFDYPAILAALDSNTRE
jgi:hypothetical protein